MKATRTMAMAVGAALLATGLFAAPSVEITSVQQQYPWTNTVDIVYTVAGVESETNGYFVVFTPTTSDGKEILDVNGEKSVQVALKGSGVYSTQWFPQTNQQYTACKMTPSVYRGAAKDYLIIDLDNWTYAYEPMATQEASNQRYNTDEYKTRYLVLRRIEGNRKYWIGDKSNSRLAAGYNTYHEVNVAKDYYLGIYHLTDGQWARIVGDGLDKSVQKPWPASKGGGNWNVIRGSALAGAVPSKGVFAVLNQKVGLGNGFDLPTESMWEIAARAGSEETYMGGSASAALAYAWVMDNNGNSSGTHLNGAYIKNVGTKLPNAWGFYDMMGNSWDQTRDVWNTGDLKDLQPEALVPITTGTTSSSPLKCGGCNTKASDASCTFSARGTYGWNHSSTSPHVGFRVAFVPE